jgi:ribosomal protein S18 acetylase RimI-like enzyme
MMNANPPLTASQQKRAAQVLSRAFSRDPFMAYVFPDAQRREQKLAALFQPVIRCSQRYGGVEVTTGGEGVLGWLSGEYFPLGLSQLVRTGMISIPLRIGPPAFLRLQGHEDVCDSALEQRATKGFAYLWVVGISPEAAGQGYGKQVIQSALAAMEHRGHSSCLLRTDNEKNVAIYKRLGFEPIHSATVPNSNLPFWILSQELT